MPVCEIYSLGCIGYQQAWDLQKQIAAEIARGERPATLLLLEHPHTYTFGRQGNADHLLWDEAELVRRGVSVHWVDRGGDVTYHGPGQLVGYPLLPLGKISAAGDTGFPKADYVSFIRRLEELIIASVSAFGVEGQSLQGLTGVWVIDEQFSGSSAQPSISKLAAIGVKVDARGITQHGFALNVNPDMSYWEGIIGCGLSYPEISLAELIDPAPTMEMVAKAIIQTFGQVFNFNVQEKNFTPQ